MALGRGQVGGGYLGALGVSPHAHTCTHTCIELQMATSMEASMFSMFNMHVRACVHMHVHAYMHGTPSHTPILTSTPIHPSATPQGVDPRNHLKFDNTSTYQDISIPFEDLKSVKNSPPMGGCVVWWVGWWVGSGKITKNFKKCWLNQDNSILFEDLWFVETLPPWMGVWVGGWVGQWVVSGQMTNNWINLDLIDIIQFCLKIYDL